MLKWNNLLPLDSCLNAPKTPGIYEIGFRVPGYISRQACAIGLNAVSYPVDFMPMYVGKSESAMRYRLSQHYKASTHANRMIREYYKSCKKLMEEGKDLPPTFQGLYFTTVSLEEPKLIESFSRLQYFNYSWNLRKETKAAGQAEGKLSKDLGHHFRKMAVRFRDC